MLKIEIGPPPAAKPQGGVRLNFYTYTGSAKPTQYMYKNEIVSRMIRGADHSASV